jgi:hypothetical protein
MERLAPENVERFRRDLLALVKTLQGNGVAPVLVTHATYFGSDCVSPDHAMLVEWRKFYPMLREEGFLDMERRMNAAVRNVAADRHIPVIDIAREMPAGPEYFADMVHFTDKGASVMAAKLAQGLEPTIGRHVLSILLADVRRPRLHGLGQGGKGRQFALETRQEVQSYGFDRWFDGDETRSTYESLWQTRAPSHGQGREPDTSR